MSIFAVLEGPTGSGKSSVAEELSEQTNMEQVQSVPEELQDAAEFTHSNCSDQTTMRFYIYVTSVVSDNIDEHTPLVKDRYIYSQEALARVWDLNFSPLETVDVKEPDEVFYLTADLETREERIEDRPKNEKFSFDPGFEREYEEVYDELAKEVGMTAIDTTQYDTPGEVALEIARELGPVQIHENVKEQKDY